MAFVCAGHQLEQWKLSVPKQKKVICSFEWPLRSLSVHPSGKLVVVYGLEQVSVVVLSLKSVKTFDLNLNNSFPICCQWHPMGDAHLMILSSDQRLRMFHITTDLNQPEQMWNLSCISQKQPFTLLSNKRGQFKSDTTTDNVVSFQIGKGDGWDSFTVYTIMENGDIYSLCPIMPLRG